jgi:hypothetical protein
MITYGHCGLTPHFSGSMSASENTSAASAGLTPSYNFGEPVDQPGQANRNTKRCHQQSGMQ